MRIKIYIPAVIVLFSMHFLSAQTQKKDTTVHRSVIVERDFQPVIQDAGKILSTPKEAEPTILKSTPIYSDFTAPLTINYSIYALPPEILVHQPAEVKKGFARIGLGYPLNTLADFMYPLVNNESNRFDVALRHLGAFGDQMHSKTTGKLQFDHLFDSFSLFARVGGSHDYFNYYGWNFNNNGNIILSEEARKYPNETYTYNGKNITLAQMTTLPKNETHWRANVNLGIKSLPVEFDDEWKYLLNFQYKLFDAVKQPAIEHHFAGIGSLEIPFNDKFLGLGVETHHLNYNGFTHSAAIPDAYTLVKINPYYKITGENFTLRLGAKSGISIGYGQLFTPSPDVAFQWNFSPQYVSLYGGVTGDLKLNSLDAAFEENRYLANDFKIKDLYTPIDAYFGVKLKPVYNFIFDIFGNYKTIRDQYFFVNSNYTSGTAAAGNENIFLNRFDVIYANANVASAGARAAFNHKDEVNVYAKAAYNYWKASGEAYAWQMPAFDVDLGGNAKVTNDINVSVQFIYQDGRYAKLGAKSVKMTPVMDLNLGASYAYKNWLSFFLKANNLLNRKYEIFNGYEVQGINGMVGATLSF